MKNNSKFIQKSELLKALAHPTRLCIVKGLTEKESNVTNIQERLDLLHKIETAMQFNFTSLLSAREEIITGALVPTSVCPTW